MTFLATDHSSKADKKLARAERKIQILEELIEDQARQIHENSEKLETATESSSAWKVREGLLIDLIEHANEAILAIDPKSGLLIEVNAAAAKRLGYSKAQLRDASIQDIETTIVSSDDWRNFVENAKKSSELSRESIYRCKDGSEFPVEVYTRYVEREGRIYFISVARDITERKRSEAKLREAQLALVRASRKAGMADVASAILHTVGNVLNSLTVTTIQLEDAFKKSEFNTFLKIRDLVEGQGDNLDEFAKKHPKAPKVLELLIRSTNTLEVEFQEYQKSIKTVMKHLGHVRSAIDRQNVHAKVAGVIEEVRLEDLVEESIQIACNDYDALGISLELESTEMEPVQVDRNKVLEILINLLSNARCAVLQGKSDKKEVKISFELMGSEKLKLSVADNGIGLSSDIRARVFEQGFTTKSDGNGLGLHASANAANQMKGSLVCDSPGIDCGATFTLLIPSKQEV